MVTVEEKALGLGEKNGGKVEHKEGLTKNSPLEN